MSIKKNILSFINSVIAGDDEQSKLYVKKMCEDKTKQILNLTPKKNLLAEADLGDNIELDGNTVMLQGKKIGILDEKDNDVVFIDIKHHRAYPIKNNDVSELAKLIRELFLGMKE